VQISAVAGLDFATLVGFLTYPPPIPDHMVRKMEDTIKEDRLHSSKLRIRLSADSGWVKAAGTPKTHRSS
jgi:hypothetical protein